MTIDDIIAFIREEVPLGVFGREPDEAVENEERLIRMLRKFEESER